MAHNTTTVPVAPGDGIGPEITEATVRILKAADPSLEFTYTTVGMKAYENGIAAGVGEDTWQAIRDHGVLLKGPITTPQGGGYKSVNVTLRKTLGLYANMRPCISYHPYVKSVHPGMDVVIIRENEEDTYAGIEHRQSDEVYQCLKLITRPGCERIIRYAFEYARSHNRKKITCMTKDNIMKITDGLFHDVFDEISQQYPDIESDHMIIDIGAARIASRPHDFDVVVTTNLYGDIISDIAAEVSGSIGLAGSLNLGAGAAMFEAVHGSAPDIAGRNVANPSGLLMSAIMMMVYMGKAGIANTIHNAWLRTVEDGYHTRDMFSSELSKDLLGTRAFADHVIERLGRVPLNLQHADYQNNELSTLPDYVPSKEKRPSKHCVGVDLFLNWDDHDRDPESLAGMLREAANDTSFELKMITNRGVKVYPDGNPETLKTDHWRCRFPSRVDEDITREIPGLMTRVNEQGLDIVKTENLYSFDGEPGYSKAQGEG